MLAVKLVKVAVVCGVMLGAVPPVPVAALGDQKFFICELALFFRRAGRRLLIEIASVIEIVPSLVILGRPDPNVKVGIDPRARNQRLEMTGSFVTCDRFRNCHSFNPRIILQSVIESSQKLSSGVRIIFPGIFAIENNWNRGVLPFSNNGLR